MRPPSTAATFWILTALSAISAFVLPASWTAPLRRPFQFVALAQWPVSATVDALSEAAQDVGASTITQERARELERENQALQMQLIHQGALLDELSRRWEALAGEPLRLPDAHMRVLMVPVVGHDADPGRATLQVVLSVRQSSLVRRGQWVAAGRAPQLSDLEEGGRALLHRQFIVGRVIEVQSRVARVQLTTDPRFRAEVRAARVLDDGVTLEMASAGCILAGRGGGLLRIEQAAEDYLSSGMRIVVVPAGADLVVPLSAGKIIASAPRADSSRHFDLTVEPWEPLESLTYVYILAAAQEQ